MFLLKYIYGQTQSEEANILHPKAEAGPHCYLSPRGSGQLRSLGRLLTAQHPPRLSADCRPSQGEARSPGILITQGQQLRAPGPAWGFSPTFPHRGLGRRLASAPSASSF